MSYPDAAQLCLRLYSTVEGVPEQFLPLSREILGDVFAKLASAGWVRDDGRHFPKVTDRADWVAVIAAIFKKGPDVVDMARGEVLARQVGFLKEKGLS
jgi:hypothetical protein